MYLITKNSLETDLMKHAKSIREGELWEIVETGRGNVKITIVTDDVIKNDKTECSSQALSAIMDG